MQPESFCKLSFVGIGKDRRRQQQTTTVMLLMFIMIMIIMLIMTMTMMMEMHRQVAGQRLVVSLLATSGCTIDLIMWQELLAWYISD